MLNHEHHHGWDMFSECMDVTMMVDEYNTENESDHELMDTLMLGP